MISEGAHGSPIDPVPRRSLNEEVAAFRAVSLPPIPQTRCVSFQTRGSRSQIPWVGHPSLTRVRAGAALPARGLLVGASRVFPGVALGVHCSRQAKARLSGKNPLCFPFPTAGHRFFELIRNELYGRPRNRSDKQRTEASLPSSCVARVGNGANTQAEGRPNIPHPSGTLTPAGMRSRAGRSQLLPSSILGSSSATTLLSRTLC